MIATPHGGLVDPIWFDAFLHMQKPLQWLRASVNRSEVAAARNLLVMMLLEPRHPRIVNTTEESVAASSETTHILFLDDDVLPPPDGLMRLLKHDAAIVSGIYTSRIPPAMPIAYKRTAEGGYRQLTEMGSGVEEVDGVGAGFLLIQREVFERMQPPWFQFVCGTEPRTSLSEDLVFCQWAQEAGYKILLDWDVQCGHLGRYVYDARDVVVVGAPAKPVRPRRKAG